MELVVQWVRPPMITQTNVDQQARRLRDASERLAQAIVREGDVTSRAQLFLSSSRTYRRMLQSALEAARADGRFRRAS